MVMEHGAWGIGHWALSTRGRQEKLTLLCCSPAPLLLCPPAPHRFLTRFHNNPNSSGKPSMIFRFWTAAPDAPLPRLSRRATSKTSLVVSLANTKT